jgi:hypothetical protein
MGDTTGIRDHGLKLLKPWCGIDLSSFFQRIILGICHSDGKVTNKINFLISLWEMSLILLLPRARLGTRFEHLSVSHYPCEQVLCLNMPGCRSSVL